MIYILIKFLRDFALCSLAALLLFGLLVYGLEQHEQAVLRQQTKPIELRR